MTVTQQRDHMADRRTRAVTGPRKTISKLALALLDTANIMGANKPTYLNRRRIMLGVIAAIALVVGGVGTAVVMSEGDRVAQETRTPVVEVQAVESTDLSKVK